FLCSSTIRHAISEPASSSDVCSSVPADASAQALTSRLVGGKTRGIDATGHGFPRRMGAEHSGNTATHITRDEGERVHVAANITEHRSEERRVGKGGSAQW